MAENPLVVQCPFWQLKHEGFSLRGRWHDDFFHNQNPIVLELGCGRGEYTVGLARRFPDHNFIGVDIKGSRMWHGAQTAVAEGLTNVGFLRTNIECIHELFGPDEVAEIWLTFSDPQMKKATKRLSSTYFLERYRHFLIDGGTIHLKTDSPFLYTYTRLMAEHNRLPIEAAEEDLYGMKNEECRMKNGIMTNTNLSQRVNGNPYSSFIILHSSLTEIRTYYEQMWLDRGFTIKYLRFRLPHEGTLAEPDVEIPVDGYRSYNHEVRSTRTTGK